MPPNYRPTINTDTRDYRTSFSPQSYSPQLPRSSSSPRLECPSWDCCYWRRPDSTDSSCWSHPPVFWLFTGLLLVLGAICWSSRRFCQFLVIVGPGRRCRSMRCLCLSGFGSSSRCLACLCSLCSIRSCGSRVPFYEYTPWSLPSSSSTFRSSPCTHGWPWHWPWPRYLRSTDSPDTPHQTRSVPFPPWADQAAHTKSPWHSRDSRTLWFPRGCCWARIGGFRCRGWLRSGWWGVTVGRVGFTSGVVWCSLSTSGCWRRAAVGGASIVGGWMRSGSTMLSECSRCLLLSLRSSLMLSLLLLLSSLLCCLREM